MRGTRFCARMRRSSMQVILARFWFMADYWKIEGPKGVASIRARPPYREESHARPPPGNRPRHRQRGGAGRGLPARHRTARPYAGRDRVGAEHGRRHRPGAGAGHARPGRAHAGVAAARPAGRHGARAHRRTPVHRQALRALRTVVVLPLRHHGFPMPDHASQLPRTQLVVKPDWTDLYGHMNAARYVRVFDHIGFQLLEPLGVGESYTRATRCGIYTV